MEFLLRKFPDKSGCCHFVYVLLTSCIHCCQWVFQAAMYGVLTCRLLTNLDFFPI